MPISSILTPKKEVKDHGKETKELERQKTMKINIDDEKMEITCDTANDWQKLKDKLRIKTNVSRAEKQPATVSYLSYEAAGARYERIIERIAIVSLIDTIIAVAALIWTAGKSKR